MSPSRRRLFKEITQRFRSRDMGLSIRVAMRVGGCIENADRRRAPVRDHYGTRPQSARVPHPGRGRRDDGEPQEPPSDGRGGGGDALCVDGHGAHGPVALSRSRCVVSSALPCSPAAASVSVPVPASAFALGPA